MKRSGHMDRQARRNGLVDLYLNFTAGTSGAVPALSTMAEREGFILPVLDSTGVLSVYLDDNYLTLVEAHGEIQQASFSNTTASIVRRASENVDDATAPVVVFNLFASGAAGVRVLANMGTGDVFTVHLVLTKSRKI